MATLKFQKNLNSLPGTLQADTIYFVSDGNKTRMYISDATGTKAQPVVGAIEGIDPLFFMGVTSGSGL